MSALSLLALAAGGCGPRGVNDASKQATPSAAAPVKMMAPVKGDHNLLINGDFEDGSLSPWTMTLTAPASGMMEVRDGQLCVVVKTPGQQPWDMVLRHRGFTIEQGHQYMLRFRAQSTPPAVIRPSVVMAGPPYVEYFAADTQVREQRSAYGGAFEMLLASDDTAELVFHLGLPHGVAQGAAADESEQAKRPPTTVCFDDIRLDDPQFEPPRRFARGPRLAVNSHGYLPGYSKVAVLAHPSHDPVGFQVVDAGGGVIHQGRSRVFGTDEASGDHVHHLDFSQLRQGRGLRIRAASKVSDDFDIRADLYFQLKLDALGYFYQNRSGVPIAAELVGDPKWAREAGHLSDKKVACLPGLKCGYQLDVSGGWYDAGDHGKYVVNGGIAVWTLLNLYERFVHNGDVSVFADGTLSIPERQNGAPDLLDEVRYGLDLFLRMQVPSGELAGMVHHKIHDDTWADLPKLPAVDDLPRHLHAPSTAATLNLAAMAAQAARVFKPVDAAFAARCLQAAEQAWDAAQRHPAMYADPADNVGGGPYGDVDVSDEMYWAAAELFISTGASKYREALKDSSHYLQVPSPQQGHTSAMTWASVGALGTISLAVVPNGLNPQEIRKARSAVVRAAGAFAFMVRHEGYRVPFDGGPTRKYPWGSNSCVVNNMILLGLAHDFTGKSGFVEAMSSGMSYLLGTNPLRTSYITGYGDHAIEQPHHRFWARAKDPHFPEPPPGVLSGGPNSGLDDPIAKRELRGCAAQKCWLDHFEAWSLNEVAINWNAPLAWVAAYLDEQATK